MPKEEIEVPRRDWAWVALFRHDDGTALKVFAEDFEQAKVKLAEHVREPERWHFITLSWELVDSDVTHPGIGKSGGKC